MISEYCERHGSGPFEEPFNTLSNVVFIWAAVEAWNFAGHRRVLTRELQLLIFLAATVGVGSAIWHICATPVAKLLDLVPILLFQLCFLWTYLRRCAGMKPAATIGVVSAYALLSSLMPMVPPYLNGSVLYIPTLIVLLCMAAYHHVTHQPERSLLGIGAILFVAAITFRSIDFFVCAWVPFGTHFLWHIFNGALLYCAMRAIILCQACQLPEVRRP